MTVNSKSLTIILFVVLFGGIMLASAAGWWVTESTKIPVTFSEGEFAGQANPADIRGSYTFGDISKSFAITPGVLAQAFGITESNPAEFAVKDLEALNLNSSYEIGTASVRLFVAYYTGLPFDTTDQEIYLPQKATSILLTRGSLSSDQIAYLEKYTVGASETSSAAPTSVEPISTPAVGTTASVDYMVKGKTTFAELIAWGVPQSVIEQIMGKPVPTNTATTLKDYVAANGLDLESLKPALQAAVDKIKP